MFDGSDIVLVRTLKRNRTFRIDIYLEWLAGCDPASLIMVVYQQTFQKSYSYSVHEVFGICQHSKDVCSDAGGRMNLSV